MSEGEAPHDRLRRALESRAKTSGSEEEKPEPPLHWPNLGAIPAERQWPELHLWVEDLRQRYPGLDSYVVPACWYTHESLVGALQALKDHERAAYAPTSPATFGTDWHRALRDLSVILRQFTADLRCGHGPEYVNRSTFEDFVADDISRRRRHGATVALGHPETAIG